MQLFIAEKSSFSTAKPSWYHVLCKGSLTFSLTAATLKKVLWNRLVSSINRASLIESVRLNRFVFVFFNALVLKTCFWGPLWEPLFCARNLAQFQSQFQSHRWETLLFQILGQSEQNFASFQEVRCSYVAQEYSAVQQGLPNLFDHRYCQNISNQAHNIYLDFTKSNLGRLYCDTYCTYTLWEPLLYRHSKWEYHRTSIIVTLCDSKSMCRRHV